VVEDPQFWDVEVSVQYDDWKGNVAWDMPDHDEHLYELAELDRDKWHIVGMQILGGRVGSGPLTSGVDFYVVPHGSGRFEEIVERGELEVTEVSVNRPGVALELFESEFKRWDIAATSKGFLREGVLFKVVEERDVDGDEDEELD
jgi:hypothetical protein